VVRLRVFKERTYAAGVFLMTVLGFVLYASLLLLPVFLQTLLGYSALDAGIAMAPRGLGSFLMMPVVGTVLSRLDPRKVLACGLTVAAWTLYELGRLNLNAGYWDIFWPQFIRGPRWRCCSCRSPPLPWIAYRGKRWATPPACST
jgi:DHA2 family multidrug resistance protein